MKRVTALLLLLGSLQLNAQCVKPLDGSVVVRYCDTHPSTNEYGTPGSCPAQQPWADLSGALVPTPDTIDTCQGYWISSASDARQFLDVAINPANFAKSFFFGVSVYLTFWYGPFLVGLGKRMINKL